MTAGAGEPSLGPDPAGGAYVGDDLEADDQRLALVEHWIGMNRPDRAIEELQRLSGPVASSAGAYLLRAQAELRRGDGARAADAMRTSIAAYGPGRNELFLLARGLNLSGDNRGAEAAVLQALATDPDDSQLLSTYAEICLDAGELDRATALLDRAAIYDPLAPMVIRVRAMIAYARGDDRGAARLEREYLAMDPDDAGANALSTYLAASRGDLPHAYRSARRWASADVGNADAVLAARELRAASHWLMWPLRPLQRFGGLPVWIAAVGTMLLLRATGHPEAGGVVALVWVTYVVYSWVVPPAVRRLVGPRSVDRR